MPGYCLRPRDRRVGEILYCCTRQLALSASLTYWIELLPMSARGRIMTLTKQLADAGSPANPASSPGLGAGHGGGAAVGAGGPGPRATKRDAMARSAVTLTFAQNREVP